MTTTTRRAAIFLSVVLATTSATTTSRAQPRPSDVDTCANAAEESQALRKEGKLTQARERLVVCARGTCPSFIQKDCATWLVEVEKSIPSVVFRATDPKGRDLTKVRVLIDGKLLTEKLDGRPISVDPGEHTLSYETAGQTTVTETVLIRQGEVNRLVSMSFVAPAADPAPPPPPPPPPPTEKSGGGSIPAVSWILGGTGIVLAGVGAGLWISGKGDHDSMESGCAMTRSCAQDDVDSAKTRLLIGDVAIGAALVAIGAAVVLAFVSKSSSASSPATAVVSR